MAHQAMFNSSLLKLVVSSFMLLQLASSSPSPRVSRSSTSSEIFCPGFPGYCSESRPGDTCLVVCAFGRNNVPECQADGTWTDAPRCIEHEPGLPEQRPMECPGIPGYCSLDRPGGLCEFQCATGPSIRSFCTPDGTWDPYPTCQGDIRETKDGCDPCPGPFGGARNRALEQQGRNQQQQRPQQRQQTQSVDRRNPYNNGNNNNNRRHNNRNNNNNNNGRHNNGRNNRNNHSQQQQNVNRRNPYNNNGGSNRNNNNGFNKRNSNNRFTNRNNKNNGFHKRHNNNDKRNNHGNFGRPEQPRSSGRGFNRASNTLQQALNNTRQCPGQSLEACIDVCPSSSTRIFGACVAGCARRCGENKK